MCLTSEEASVVAVLAFFTMINIPDTNNLKEEKFILVMV